METHEQEPLRAVKWAVLAMGLALVGGVVVLGVAIWQKRSAATTACAPVTLTVPGLEHVDVVAGTSGAGATTTLLARTSQNGGTVYRLITLHACTGEVRADVTLTQ